MKKLLKQLFLFGILASVCTTMIQCTKIKDKAVQFTLDAEAKKLNKDCPILVDKFTRLDSCISLSPRTLQNNYTISNGLLQQEGFSADLSQKQTAIALKINLMTNDVIKPLRKKGVTFSSIYRNENGELLYRIDILPEQYKSGILTTDEEVYQLIQSDITNTNLKLPLMIDDITRYDNCKAVHPRTFEYNYTLLKTSPSDKDVIEGQVIPSTKNNIKTNPDLNIYRLCDITFRYIYKDTKGNEIHRFDVTPSDYK